MSFDQTLTEDRRLTILKGLQAAVQYRANAFLMRRYVDTLGHAVSADRLEQDLAWLAEQGLVTLAKPEGVTVATLTARGLDVAAGLAATPGVARPQPEL